MLYQTNDHSKSNLENRAEYHFGELFDRLEFPVQPRDKSTPYLIIIHKNKKFIHKMYSDFSSESIVNP